MSLRDQVMPHLVHVGWIVANVDFQSAGPPHLRGRKSVEILWRIYTPLHRLLLAENYNVQQFKVGAQYNTQQLSEDETSTLKNTN